MPYDKSGRDFPGPGNCIGPADDPPDEALTEDEVWFQDLAERVRERKRERDDL